MKKSTPRKLAMAALIAMATLPTAFAAPQLTVLHSFKGRPGRYPKSGLVSDAAGNFYGTARIGGCQDSCGVVFELTKSKKSWNYHVLYVFRGGSDGAEPNGGLVLDANGNLYGTTVLGGIASCLGVGCGTVFQLSPNSSGGWAESVLYRFQGGSDGSAPEDALIFDSQGNLYGTTLFGGNAGGACPSYGCGTVFDLSPVSGGGWNESILYRFSGTDGSAPWAGLIADAQGNFFGTTENGGKYRNGVAFELSPSSGGTWNEKVLHDFTGADDGASPTGRLTFDASGNLYGTAIQGGNSTNCSVGCGAVFELEAGSGGTWTEKTLYTFSGGTADGASPGAAVSFDTNGNLYGTTTYGVGGGAVFKLTPGKGTWKETIVHAFDGTDGRQPDGDLIWDKAGNLYSTTTYGGQFSFGTAFKLRP